MAMKNVRRKPVSMVDIAPQEHSELKIPFYLIDGREYFTSSCVAKMLGLKNINQRLANLVGHKTIFATVNRFGKTSGQIRANVCLMTIETLKAVAVTSRSSESKEALKKIGVEVASSCVESVFIDLIQKAFQDCRPVKQKACKTKRIDLYLEKYSIAIECDETNFHRNREEEDAARQFAIEEELGCRFVRFNPNAPLFNVGDVIYEIRKIIESQNCL